MAREWVMAKVTIKGEPKRDRTQKIAVQERELPTGEIVEVPIRHPDRTQIVGPMTPAEFEALQKRYARAKFSSRYSIVDVTDNGAGAAAPAAAPAKSAPATGGASE